MKRPRLPDFTDQAYEQKVSELKKRLEQLELDHDIADAKYETAMAKEMTSLDEHRHLMKKFKDLLASDEAGSESTRAEIAEVMKRLEEIEGGNRGKDELAFSSYYKMKEIRLKIMQVKAELRALGEDVEPAES